MVTSFERASPLRTPFGMRDALLLGGVSGVVSHLPWLVLARTDALRTFAVGMLAVFWFFDPWLTVPLGMRLRREPRRPSGDGGALALGAFSGLVAGTVASATVIVWERVVHGEMLSWVDLAGQLIYPLFAATYGGGGAGVALALRRRRLARGDAGA